MNKYFSYVPVWAAILVNSILGIIASAPFLLAVIFMFGLFKSPTTGERLIGFLIIAGIIAVIFLVNYVVYRFFKKRGAGKRLNIDPGKRIVYGIIVFVILLLLVLSFFLFPDLWLFLNGWWF